MIYTKDITNKIIEYGICYFLLLLFCIIFLNSGQNTPAELIIISFLLFLSFTLCFSLGISLNIKSNIILIFFYNLCLSLSLYFFFLNFAESPYGYNPIDANTYYNFATSLKDLPSGKAAITYLQNNDVEISDYGFPLILKYIFQYTGNDNQARILLIFINSSSFTIGSILIFKLSLFFLKYKKAKLVMLLWGLNSCAIWCNVSGLKEAIFLTLILGTVYYMYCWFYKKNIKNLILMFGFILSTLFFRHYITLFFILLLLFKGIYQRLSSKWLFIILFCLWVVATFTSYLITSENPLLSLIIYKQTQAPEGGGGNLFRIIMNSLAGFTGPYPNFILFGNKEAIIYSPYSLLKSLISLFGLYGIFYAIKNNQKELYPLILFVYLNIILVITTIFSFDYRFSYTMIPMFFLLSVYGFFKLKENKYNKIISLLYTTSILGIIFLYNAR